jgi:hypothetical protein
MELSVEIKSGPQAGKTVLLRPGKIIQVGRTSWADLSVPQDSTMSGMHFAIECGNDKCRVRDLKSTNGTLVNGFRITEMEIGDGDQIMAGQTCFLVRSLDQKPVTVATLPTVDLERQASAGAPNAEPPEVLQVLQRTSEPLFALVDAARDTRAVLAFLHSCTEEHQSLYEGPKGEQLAAAAPYLVRLPVRSSQLESLIRQAWGNSWGIYLTCARSFKDVRQHLRHFLFVKTAAGEEVYFRFYDPRVLRLFLPTCNPQQATEFFGPIRSFLLEDAEPTTLLRFPTGRQPPKADLLRVTVSSRGEATAAGRELESVPK